MARDATTARHLQEQQKLGAIHKTYLALVHGAFPHGPMNTTGWLVPDRQSTVRKKRRYIPCLASEASLLLPSRVSDGPDHAEPPEPGAESSGTLLTGIDCWQAADGRRSLIEAQLRTGRTHQIRACLYSLGYPVVGDKLYGLDEAFFLRFMDNTLTPEDTARLVLPYQALHCASLEFHDPDGNKLAFSAPAPWAGIVNQSGYGDKS
jgi:23S rRNA pseudouridine955/2504/2580 synthase/23S rRNA pseudouridine1911/1915/1917 synthase